MLLTIGKRFVDEMIAHSKDEHPNECCGILAGRDDVVMKAYRITNMLASPERFLMDRQDLLRAEHDAKRNGWDVMAIYHSHMDSPAYPSSMDVRMAQQSGWLCDGVYYILVSLMDGFDAQVRTFAFGKAARWWSIRVGGRDRFVSLSVGCG